MTEKNTLVEEALLQMENLQDAITENAKGILASTMKEEISELVKESLKEDEIEESEMETEESSDEMKEQEEPDMGDVEVDDDELESDDVVGMDDLDGLEDDETEMDDMDDLDDEMLDDMPDELDIDDESEELMPLDLTSASDEDVIKVFKAMGPDDGIRVVQKDDTIQISNDETGEDYLIKMNESETEEDETIYEIEMEEGDDEKVTEEEVSEDDIVYEIQMDEEEETSEEEMSESDVVEESDDEEEGDDKEDDEEEKGETKEGRTKSHSLGKRSVKTPENYPKFLKRFAQRNESLENEVANLREKNEEYRKALNIFREKLNEVAVFNSNLAYATRLFTEHSTTKQEKINILRRFDNVESLKESKNLYKVLKDDLSSKENNVVTESIESRVQKSPSKGSATNLIESKTYENPQFQRMKDLMNKIK